MSCPICSKNLYSRTTNHSKYQCEDNHYEIFYKPIKKGIEITNTNQLTIIAERIMGKYGSIYIDHCKNETTIQYDHINPKEYRSTIKEILKPLEAYNIVSEHTLACAFSKTNEYSKDLTSTN